MIAHQGSIVIRVCPDVHLLLSRYSLGHGQRGAVQQTGVTDMHYQAEESWEGQFEFEAATECDPLCESIKEAALHSSEVWQYFLGFGEVSIGSDDVAKSQVKPWKLDASDVASMSHEQLVVLVMMGTDKQALEARYELRQRLERDEDIANYIDDEAVKAWPKYKDEQSRP